MKQLRLVPVAAAALMALSAQAADVQMFGFFDQGLSYVHEDLNKGMAAPKGQTSADEVDANGKVGQAGNRSSFTQGTGNVSTWGIKGSEDLGNGTKVIFHLESGFLADDGTIYGDGTNIFERESSVGIESSTWGQLKFGRMPALTTGSGTTGIFNSKTNPFGAGWGNMTGGWKFVGTLGAARHNNMINYISPSWNGLKLHAQYSFKSGQNATQEEGKSQTDRWAAVGATLTGEKFYLAAAADWLNAASYGSAVKQADDAYKVLVGGHYNFDAFKLYGSAQYMKNIAYIGGYSTKEFAPLAKDQDKSTQKGFEAWAVATGVDFNAAGGTVKFSVGYGQGEDQNLKSNNKMKRANVGLGYVYPFSKRTSVYGITGAFWQDADWQQDDITAHEVIIGLMHRW